MDAISNSLSNSLRDNQNRHSDSGKKKPLDFVTILASQQVSSLKNDVSACAYSMQHHNYVLITYQQQILLSHPVE